MNTDRLKQIEDRMTPPAAPEPPEGLLEKIQEEIPGYLRVVPEPVETPSSGWKLRALAASVVLVVVGGAVVYRVTQQAPTLEERLNEETVRSWQEIVESPTTENRAAAASEVDKVAGKPIPEQISSEKSAVQAEPAPQSVAVEGTRLEPLLKAKAHDQRKDAAEKSGRDGRSRQDAQDLRVQREVGSAQVDRPAETPRMEEQTESMEQEVITVTSESPLLSASAKNEVRAKEKKRPAQPRAGLYMMAFPSSNEPPTRQLAPPSTGGTAEPNDAAYGDMFFRTYGTNPFVDTEDDALSTFGLDVDTGSFTLARSYLDRGHLPPPEAIRVEEFVNFFDYGDPAPRRGEFTLTAEEAPSPFATGNRERLVRFGVKAQEVVTAERDPAVLIFVVDVSGSMGREDRLGLVKRSLELLLDQLTPEDQIGLVVYGSRGEILLEPTASKDAIRRAIDRLVPAGSTNAEEGLELAYELARRNYQRGTINRVILCSDGVANVGRTGPESILDRVRIAADEGIELTTVGFGMGNYNDLLMEQLADQGDGTYAYVDSLDEARRLFVENLTGTLQTIASDAKAQVEFNPKAVSRYRLLGYENRDIADERFRDDTVDAGEIGAGHEVTALYEIKLHEDVNRRDRLATLRLRYRSKATDEVIESSIDLKVRDMAPSWESSSIALQLSSLAAEFAEILKGSYWAKDSDLEQVHRHLRPLADELATDEQIQDLLFLVERAQGLSPGVQESVDN